MKKIFVALFLLVAMPVWAEDIVIPPVIKQSNQQEKPIENLTQYFEYLPNAVHRNWIPYKANADYEVTVQFRVKKNGEITKPFIVESTNEQANASVLNAVQTGAPYKPLPAKFPGDGVNTQVQLKYIKN